MAPTAVNNLMWPLWLLASWLSCQAIDTEVSARRGLNIEGTGLEGTDLNLTCLLVAAGVEDKPLQWLKEGLPLPDKTHRTWTLQRLRPEDAGRYTCCVGDPSMDRNCSGKHINVLVPPKLRIEPVPKGSTYVIKENENLTLTCRVIKAFPSVQSQAYTWKFAKKPEGPYSPFKSKINRLPLGPMTRDNSGIYTCQARNNEGLGKLLSPGQANISIQVSAEDGGQNKGNNHTTPPVIDTGDKVGNLTNTGKVNKEDEGGNHTTPRVVDIGDKGGSHTAIQVLNKGDDGDGHTTPRVGGKEVSPRDIALWIAVGVAELVSLVLVVVCLVCLGNRKRRRTKQQMNTSDSDEHHYMELHSQDSSSGGRRQNREGIEDVSAANRGDYCRIDKEEIFWLPQPAPPQQTQTQVTSASQSPGCYDVPQQAVQLTSSCTQVLHSRNPGPPADSPPLNDVTPLCESCHNEKGFNTRKCQVLAEKAITILVSPSRMLEGCKAGEPLPSQHQAHCCCDVMPFNVVIATHDAKNQRSDYVTPTPPRQKLCGSSHAAFKAGCLKSAASSMPPSGRPPHHGERHEDLCNRQPCCSYTLADKDQDSSDLPPPCCGPRRGERNRDPEESVSYFRWEEVGSQRIRPLHGEEDEDPEDSEAYCEWEVLNQGQSSRNFSQHSAQKINPVAPICVDVKGSGDGGGGEGRKALQHVHCHKPLPACTETMTDCSNVGGKTRFVVDT